jgi:heavy metal sensor kinase
MTAGRVLGVAKRWANLVRGLRFRLTVSYVLFFSVLLVGVGLLFRQTLKYELDGDVEATVEEEWGAAKAYLRIEKGHPVWVADSKDPEEAYIVERLRHVYALADSKGKLLEYSATYEAIGIPPPEEVTRILKLGQPVIRERQDVNGVPYLIKAGAVPDDRGRPYYFAIGRSLEANERNVYNFTRQYFLILPGLIALASLLGWLLAGRALRPLNMVAQTAQRTTSANLAVQLRRRGAEDELDNLIDSFNRMTERLSQSFDQIRQFSTDVSHELRTPLTAIRGQLEVALFTAETPEQYRDAMVNALEDVEKLSSIVRALLLLSQAESGQLALQKTHLDLSEVAADIADQFQIPAEEKRLTLTAELMPNSLVSADRTQMDRLISNLLSNAVKYTPAGGEIRVRTEIDAQDPNWVKLSVEDTGAGIAAEDLPHIFDRFYRVRNAETNRVQGLGLGLSFVSWIVSAHDGTIDVQSTPGKGTTFIVRLPLVTATAPPAAGLMPEPDVVTTNS